MTQKITHHRRRILYARIRKERKGRNNISIHCKLYNVIAFLFGHSDLFERAFVCILWHFHATVFYLVFVFLHCKSDLFTSWKGSRNAKFNIKINENIINHHLVFLDKSNAKGQVPWDKILTFHHQIILVVQILYASKSNKNKFKILVFLTKNWPKNKWHLPSQYFY